MKGLLSFSLLAIAGSLLSMPMPADAQIYKCIAADGSVSYSGSPCATDAKVSTVLKGSVAKAPIDCRLVSAFSSSVAQEMKTGTQSKDVIAQYGGMDSLSSTAESIISYVYSFQGESGTTLNRIVSLSEARCENGAFSRATDCQYFPPTYLAIMGGCAVLKGEAALVTASNEPEFGMALPLTSLEEAILNVPSTDRAVDIKRFNEIVNR